MPLLFLSFSSTYFWYFSVIGLVVPFLSVFLDNRGFSSLQIGEIIAIFTATKIIGPTMWATFADKSGKQLMLIRYGSFFTVLSFCLLFYLDGYWPISFALALFGLFWTSILPQIEAMTLASIRRSAKIYARIRLWGSVGFIVSAIIAGEVMSAYSSEAFVWLGVFILIGLYLSSLLLKQPKIRLDNQAVAVPIIERVLTKRFIYFFIAGLLLQVSFGPYYSFYALYLSDLNYPSYAVGLFLGLSVLVEIVIFYYLGTFFKYFSLKMLLVFSLFITAIRWYVTGELGGSVVIMVIAQLIHAFSFGLYHSVCMEFLQQHFTKTQQNRGQALYISGVYGVGGVIGAYISGLLWLEGKGAVDAYTLAALSALLAGGFALMIPDKSRV